MEHILLESSRDGAIVTLTLNRPAVRNAFNSTTITELQRAFLKLGQDPRVRFVVLTGAGQMFCGGADINWMRASRDFTLDKNRRDAAAMAAMYRTLARLPKVTLARVNGPCYGGGVGLVAACDLAIAVDTASFAFSEVNLGIIPAVIAPHVMAKLGYARTLEYFLRGTPLDARKALEYGLLSEVVTSEGLDEAVAQQLRELRTSAPTACTEVKALLRQLPWTPPDRVDDLTVGIISRLRSGPEGQEGLSAFIEKRKPQWALAGEEDDPAPAPEGS